MNGINKRAFRYAGLEYAGLTNLGDHIQSIAIERLLPKISKRFDRDSLARVDDRYRYVTIMNGWFTHNPKDCFPPSSSILPIFWGFHITNWNDSWRHFLEAESIEYLRAFEPIGCRDRVTQRVLDDAGVSSFYSKCLTLTLPRRKRPPKNGWNVIVDVPMAVLPPQVGRNALYCSHLIPGYTSEGSKMAQAHKLLKFYRDHARLVITTRLHCALPCVAMGIPVIFFGDSSDYRVSIIKDVGLEIYDLPKRSKGINPAEVFWERINWTPDALNFEEEKMCLLDQFESYLSTKLGKFAVKEL